MDRVTTILEYEGEEITMWFELAFSKDYKNIYFTLNYRFHTEVHSNTVFARSLEDIIEIILESLQQLRLTEYFDFEPEAISLSETSNNTYILRDNTNNIEVHYDFQIMSITKLVIGFI